MTQLTLPGLIVGTAVPGCPHKDCNFADGLNENGSFLPDSPEACPYEKIGGCA